ncbi:hypothetical protein PHYSODRAFT_300508 [Phytophthora sojae]|uniref:Uncharacterized protein n=1 Tax=Phytophthora sojae (strain P6497) TaxID=1094619 RepID=G4ZE75_PHYSP|nr:hypothetical protein PHYSODRAFT_300508 [Phytophthora sojae]EGZ17426.1 hypothetical protein PHYSODRAFT_300508 [Phytophthora sojae]|eukprot:XP_009526484.1 hypothetical protein PHYSODRAFT_300508 [Phytophthora sojae]
MGTTCATYRFSCGVKVIDSAVSHPAADKGKVTDSAKAVSNDGSVAAVRRSVAAQWNDELAARESGRAERYVSTMGDDGGDDQVSGAVTDHSTVEMTMVRKRATTEMATADESAVTAPSPAPANTNEVPTSEEGSETTDGVRLAEESGTAATRQAAEVRDALEARRQQRAAGDEVRVDERARVNQVRYDSATMDEEADGGSDADVTAGVDFLGGRRAAMDFDRGERHEPAETRRTDGGRAPDGEEGVFQPTMNNGAVRLAVAVTKVEKGKALIPAINTYGCRIKLPSRKELGELVTAVRSDAADAAPATKTTAAETTQMQTVAPDAPMARGDAVCVSSAAAEATHAEDATNEREVELPTTEPAVPVQQLTDKTTEVVVTVNGTTVEPSNDPASTIYGTTTAQRHDTAAVATTNRSSATVDGMVTVHDGMAMEVYEENSSTTLAPTASRRRTKKAVEPAIRRSARIRERAERHVHQATTNPAETTRPARSRTLDSRQPRRQPLATSTDVPNASVAVEPRTTTTETTGAPTTASAAPAVATPAPRARAAPAPQPTAARGVDAK